MQLCESDAKFKYCPLLKTRDDKLKFCQGSMCMFWRWADAAKTGSDEQGFCGAAGVALAAALHHADDAPQRSGEDD